ncbi:MAG: T9SS type A sorting domain-containing protein [Bacteroidia bacterium]
MIFVKTNLKPFFSSFMKPICFSAFVLLYSYAGMAQTTWPSIQQGIKLVGTGALDTTNQGGAVCISADGNTALVGGNGDSLNTGAVWAYTRTAGVWSQQGNKLTGTGATGPANQGQAVSVSADGNTAILGGDNDSNEAGAAWIFTRTAGVWTQQGSKLFGTGAARTAGQGWSVSISSDGNTAVVGGPYDHTAIGAVWVFIRSGGIWTQQGNKLVGTGHTGSSEQGSSVSISGDGNTILVGADGDSSGVGAAWVFTRSGSVWSQQGSKLTGTGALGTSVQGCAVSLSNDGNTAIVGGNSDNFGIGAAWVYTRSGGVWTQQGSKLLGTGGNAAQFGNSVSLSGDGNMAVIGGNTDNSGTGAVWVFTRSTGVWTQQGSKLTGTGSGGAAYQGSAVALSADGTTAIVGGNQDNVIKGASWIFVSAATAGITEYGKLNQQLTAFPNPNTGIFILHAEREGTYTLLNTSGQELRTLKLNTGNNYTIQIDGLEAGLYFIRGINEQEVTRVKVVVVK